MVISCLPVQRRRLVAGTVIVFPFEHAIQQRDDGHLCVPTPLKSASSCGRGPADTLKRFPDPGEEAPWDPVRFDLPMADERRGQSCSIDAATAARLDSF